MDSLCHPWFTTINLSYRFPTFEYFWNIRHRLVRYYWYGFDLVWYWSLTSQDMVMVCMVFFTHEPRQAAKAYLFNASESPTCFCYLLELALNKLTWFWSPLGASDLTSVRSGPLAPIRHSSHSLSTYPVSTVATLGIWNNCGQNPPLKLPLRSSCIMLWVDSTRLSLPDAMERDFNLSLLLRYHQVPWYHP